MTTYRFIWPDGTHRSAGGETAADAFYSLGFGFDDFAQLDDWETHDAEPREADVREAPSGVVVP